MAGTAKKPRIFKMSFASVYPLYVQKAARLVDALAKGKKLASILRD